MSPLWGEGAIWKGWSGFGEIGGRTEGIVVGMFWFEVGVGFEGRGESVVGAWEIMEAMSVGTEAGVTLLMVTKAGRRTMVVGIWEGSTGCVWERVEGCGSGRGMLEAESISLCG
jgi:hypothetical protein